MDGDDDDGEIVTLHHHHHQQEQTPLPPQAPPPSPIDEDMFGLTHNSEIDGAFGIRSIIRPQPGGRGGGSRRERGGAIVLPSPILYEEDDEEEEAMGEVETEHHHQKKPSTNMNNAKLETPLDVDALNEMLSSMCRLRDQAPDPREAQALVEAAEHAGVEIDGVTILRLKQLEQIHEQCSPLR
jgi:hypothetical protein